MVISWPLIVLAITLTVPFYFVFPHTYVLGILNYRPLFVVVLSWFFFWVLFIFSCQQCLNFRTFAGELIHETWGLYSSSCLPRNWCWRARRVCFMIFTRLAHGGKWNGYETLKTLLPHVFVSCFGPDREHCSVAFLSVCIN